MPRSEQETWRRHLRKLIRLARRIENLGLIGRQRSEPLAIVTYEMLVQSRRLAEAIDRLGVENSYEAGVLARAMLETWVNARWIRLKESRRRANRFINFDAVDLLKLAKKVPTFALPDNSAERIRLWKRDRNRVRHLFRKNSGWVGTWAIARSGTAWKQYKNLDDRLQQVSKKMQEETGDPAIDKDKRTILYVLYSLFSQHPHGSQRGLANLPEIAAMRTASGVQQSPVLSMNCAAMFLLASIGDAHHDLTQAYESEISALIDQQRRIFQL